MPGGRTSHSVLPTAEMGTAQQHNTMAVRKTIAQQLSNVAKALEKDQTKEKVSAKVGAATVAARIAIANAIMPKKFNYPAR